MATLTGELISETYDALLKVTDNSVITGVKKRITDGFGNSTPLLLSSTDLEVDGNFILSASTNAASDTDKFLVLDTTTVKYRTGSQVLSDIGGQGTITLTTTGTSGAATLIGNTLNVPNYADGGVLSLGAIGSSPNANAGTITGTVLNLEPASASFGGVVTTGTQTIAGAKTLTGALVGTTGSFASNGGSDTFTINHSSGAGIALNITKGGAGEGIYVNKTSGSGNAVTIIGTLNATSLVKSGGTSAQFLKADGTVDSTAYGTGSVTSVAALTLGTSGTDLNSSVANGTTTPVITLNVPNASATARGVITTGSQTIAGDKNFTGNIAAQQIASNLTSGYAFFTNNITNGFGGYFGVSGTGSHSIYAGAASGNSIQARNNSSTYATINVINDGSGNIATFGNSGIGLASITNTGGATLTGALTGTTAMFTSSIGNTVSSTNSATGGLAFYGLSSAGGGAQFQSSNAGSAGLIARNSGSGVIQYWMGNSSIVATLSQAGGLDLSSSLIGTSATFSSNLTLGGYLTGQGTNPGGLGASRYVVDFNAGNTRIFSYGANTSTAGGYLFYIQSSDGSVSSIPLTIASTGAATFSSTVSVKNAALTTSVALSGSYFGYSSSYDGVKIGTSGAASLFFNVDVSANSSGSFSGNGSEYVWRNAGTFLTPNVSNNGYNKLFTWNSSGQMTVENAATFSGNIILDGSNAYVRGSTTTGFLVNSNNDASNLFVVSNSGALRLFTYGAGALTTDASGNVTATSDERLKNISGFYTTGLDALKNIKPITYKWKEETKLDTANFYTGFSAQNIHKNIPQAAGRMANGDLTIQERPIMATMINAINELNEKIIALKAEIDILKNK